MLLSQLSFHFYTLPFSSFLTHTLYPVSFLISLISSSFLFYSSYHSLFFSFSLSSLFITSHFTSSFSLSPLSYYSSIHSNHIPCLLSSSHLHRAHHLAYSSIIHPTSFSCYSPFIPLFSHFSLFHSSISPWCSSRFPQNSFSLISFIISFYSLFHHSFHPISLPSPSSPHISDFHSHSHLCSLSIHFLFILTLSVVSCPSLYIALIHFIHSHSHSYTLHSTHPIHVVSSLLINRFSTMSSTPCLSE